MSTILAIAILIAGILAAAGLAILALVITAIHHEERRASLSEQPSAFAEILARKIMDVHVSQPEARRILAARHAHIARKTAARGAVPSQRPLAAPDPARPPAASGLSSTTAAGLARRITAAQWRAVETGPAAVTERMLALLPAPRAAALTERPVTIDLDATAVEACGSRKRGVA